MFNRFLLVLVIAMMCAPAHASKPNNPFGMMLMTAGDAHTAGQLLHMQLAHDMIGDWGYVRLGTGFEDRHIDKLVTTIVACRAMRMIPVVTGLYLPPEYYEEDDPSIPKRDPDGSLASHSDAYEDWLRRLYDRGVTIPYFEYGNEVNIAPYRDNPELYAEMAIAASIGFKRVDPNISFGTAGMAGTGYEYYDVMLTRAPELKDHIDHWGLHPYAVNHPPGFTDELGDYGVGGHRWTARTLAKHGIHDPVFIMSETGYELGNEKDDRFPKITEELRAEYLVEAYNRYWLNDPRVRGVMLFALQDTRWSGWNGWDFVREDFSFTPMYEALRDMPKPEGSDHMPSGPCTVSGRIIDEDLGRPVDGYLVWIRRVDFGCYAAVTDQDGYFEIADVPEGEYDISGFSHGFESTRTYRIALEPGETKVWNAVVKRVGLLSPIDGIGPISAAWSPLSQDTVYSMDTQVKRSGSSSQRIQADGGVHGIWEASAYESCLPDNVYSAEVWVKTEGLVVGDGEGVTLTIMVCDSFNRPYSEASVKLSGEGDIDWQPLTVAISSVPEGRRFRTTLSVEAEAGTVWFDDGFLFNASWPLPSAYEAEKSASELSVAGTVFGPDGRVRLGKATVSTVPLGRWAITDRMGHFTIDGLPEGEYRVFAFHPDFVSASVENVQAVMDSAASRVTIALGEIIYPDELIDPGFENIPEIPTWFTGWSRFGTVEGIVPAGWHKGLGITEYPDGFQPRTGEGFYGAVAGSNIKEGGIFQTISVEPNALYEVSVWSHTFQTADGSRGDVANRLGVDPMGGRNVESPYIIWTPLRPSHGEWTQLKLLVRPVKPKMTVYLHHLQVHGLYFNCNFFDDVEMKKIGPPEDVMTVGDEIRD